MLTFYSPLSSAVSTTGHVLPLATNYLGGIFHYCYGGITVSKTGGISRETFPVLTISYVVHH